MKCKFCGNEIEKGVKFCPVCGTEVTQENGYTDSGQSGWQNEDADKQDRYGGSDSAQGGYSQPNSNPEGYSYGQPDNNPGGYGYGQPGNNPGGYGYGQPDNNPYIQTNYEQSNNGYNQSGGGYSQMNYNQPNYGQPVEQINGTPYLIFSILATICCCIPLGAVSIVYASKINSLQRVGDYEGAKDAAKKAKIFCIFSAIAGIIASIVMGVYLLDDLDSVMDSTSIVSHPLEEDRDEDKYKDEDKGDEASKAPVKASEDLGDSWKNYTVQINDVVLTFPCSIADVEATGLIMDTENTPEDYVINKDDYELVFFDDNDYHSLMFVISNNTEEAHVVRECTVNGVYVNDYDVEGGNITVVFPGDIRIGTDIETVIEKWGEPDDVYEGDYADSYHWYDEDSMNYCTVSTEPGEDKIITIDLDGQYLK